MVDSLLVHDLLLIVLLWLGSIQYNRWVRDRSATGPTPRKLATPFHKHPPEPKPFPGLTPKPHCTACEQVPAPAEPFRFHPPAVFYPTGTAAPGGYLEALL